MVPAVAPRQSSRVLRAARHLNRLNLATWRFAALAWAPVFARTDRAWAAGRITDVASFGSNPGQLRMHVFAPPTPVPADAPLIVVLHGCGQDAKAFATDAGWIDLARHLGVPLVLPQQTRENQRNRCFNWYRPGDISRGSGEAMSIRQMVRAAITHFGSDRKRVFIVGLSAGGAMAAAMLAAYPAVFAGGAIVAGMPVGTATTSPMALLRMYRANAHLSRAGLVAAVRAATPARGRQPWPRLSIWHGGRDRTVDPANAEVLAAQWGALHGCDAVPMTDDAPAPGVRRRAWGNAARPAVELWTIDAMAHGFPIDARIGAGSRPGPWVLDTSLPAARHIAEFWGIDR